MKKIEFYDCTECPFVVIVHCGLHLVCNHTQVQVKFPYAKDRKASPEFMKKHCPIPEVKP